MIVGAAVCPGAPFLIPGTADAIAARLSSVVDACSTAVSALAGADALLLITSAATGLSDGRSGQPGWRELAPGTIISSAPVRRSDLPDSSAVALPSGGVAARTTTAPTPAPAVSTLSVGTMVGAALLAARVTDVEPRSGSRAIGQQAPTTAIEITGDPADVAAMLADRVNSAERIAVLVIADGSACHGDGAPGRRDDRAASFDAALADALSAGDPGALRLAAGDRHLAGELLAGVDPLLVLALLTAQRPPTSADLLYAGSLLGVGYLVASWRWANG